MARTQKTLHTLDTHPTPSHGWFEPRHEYLLKPHSHLHGFRNPWPMPKHDVNVVDWMLHRHPAPWPTWEDALTHATTPTARPDADLSDWQVWFVGHATVLIQIGPYHFLTDPVWAMRASPLAFAGPKRIRPAGIALDALPRIDGVLLSHNHYDHMDMAALKWLHARDQMPIYTGLVNSQYLPADMNVIELDWWQQIAFCKDERLNIVFTPAQHFSGRGLKDRNKALWGGLSILTPDDHLFFAGDTGYAAHFSDIKAQLGAPRLALLPIGAYEPRNVMQAMHMNPAEAVQAHIDLAARLSLAIHYRTFQLTDEAMHQPLLDLALALTDQQIRASAFVTPLEGQSIRA
ncbi:MAG: hypothetical protein RLY58_1583 [Pseudomonadota bacterium]|jgi:L-ascorbate metabolism protein UlaG (beta-lactamase superfamily)